MKKIFFIQLAGASGAINYHIDIKNNQRINLFPYFLPYSISQLHAYLLNCKEITDNYIINNNYLFYNDSNYNTFLEKIDEDIDYSADIFCFSCYSWNLNFHLKLAKHIKQNKPNSLIIFGGQSIEINPTDFSKNFLITNNFIDILVHGFGEIVLQNILNNISDYSNVNNITFVKNKEIIINKIKKMNISDYKKNFSPFYPVNLFEPMLDKIKHKKNTVFSILFETNRGCPFECTFCEWGKDVGNAVWRLKDDDFIEKEIKAIFSMASKYKEYYIFGVFIIDSNFGLTKRDLEFYKIFIKYKNLYNFKNFGIAKQDSKIVTDHLVKIEEIANEAGTNFYKMVAIQTFNQETLKNIKRPYVDKTKIIKKRSAFKKTRNHEKNRMEIIFSLPGKHTYENFIFDLNTLMDCDLFGVFFAYICYSGINTEINEPEYKEKYSIITEKIPEFDEFGKFSHQNGIVQTDSFTREEFKKMWKINILFTLIHQNKPYNILAQVIRYLHASNIIKLGNFMEKFYHYVISKNSFIGKKLRHVFLYIDLVADGYYSKNINKKIKQKFICHFINKNFNKYVDDINNFIKTSFEEELAKHLLKMISTTVKLNIGTKTYFKGDVLDTPDVYGIHGIYYSKYLNITLENK